MSLVYGGDDKVPQLPIVDLCEDRVTLPVEGGRPVVPAQDVADQAGAGSAGTTTASAVYLEGGPGQKQGELRQAEEAFEQLLQDPDPARRTGHGYLNLARVYMDKAGSTRQRKPSNKASDGEPAGAVVDGGLVQRPGQRARTTTSTRPSPTSSSPRSASGSRASASSTSPRTITS